MSRGNRYLNSLAAWWNKRYCEFVHILSRSVVENNPFSEDERKVLRRNWKIFPFSESLHFLHTRSMIRFVHEQTLHWEFENQRHEASRDAKLGVRLCIRSVSRARRVLILESKVLNSFEVV